MPPLPTNLRRDLEKAVLAAREAAEKGALNALKVLAVDEERSFDTMSPEQRCQRSALRARVKVLAPSDTAYKPTAGVSRGFGPLVEEVAYQQWHRMLFARFLAENDLLIHPRHGIPVSLEECAELAATEGEPDEWMVAAKFASELLPGIFRGDDPTAQVRFAANDRAALESILKALPSELFRADDALGWVYQFWQTKAKEEVNKSERKVGGKDLAPVTQLFTEDYMVRFLLENSLGAWWAVRHPDSPLMQEWKYLRWRDAVEGEEPIPAAGRFDGWPATAREVTVMDPCCGSGHFLVAAGEMLRKMRMEEEGLGAVQAAEAVLRDNLFGLELDPRCTQIAAFSLVFDAWKSGLAPKTTVIPNIACSGIPVSGQLDEWVALAGDDVNLRETLTRLYALFEHAEDLGSLINPAALSPRDQLFTSRYEDVAPLLHEALKRSGNDPAVAVFGSTAEGVERAGRLLSRQYTLVATNPPYLSRQKQADTLRGFADAHHMHSRADIATMFIERCRAFASQGAAYVMVTPQNWLFLGRYHRLRERQLKEQTWDHVSRMGSGAFDTIGGEVVNVALVMLEQKRSVLGHVMTGIDTSEPRTSVEKARLLSTAPLAAIEQCAQLENPDAAIMFAAPVPSTALLSEYADAYQGIGTSDNPQFLLCYWEIPTISDDWRYVQSAAASSGTVGGCSLVLPWEDGEGRYLRHALALKAVGRLGGWKSGGGAWGRQGVAVNVTREMRSVRYLGTMFDTTVAAIIPKNLDDLAAISEFISSESYRTLVREIDQALSVTEWTLLKVPFDLDHWRRVAAQSYPNGLPDPDSDDPTQWLFNGNTARSGAPLQVAVARLLGYRWPDQKATGDGIELVALEDEDGIICLPALQGEKDGAERLRSFLVAAYGESWAPGTLDELLKGVGYEGKSLDQWLRDGFFEQHCKLFHHRPFIWQIWDGRRDGFSALVNYHRLDHGKLQKLAYTYLGSWIERQRDEKAQGLPGSDDRLAAALVLQKKLADILAGEPPYDIYVRWKKLHEQAIGWNPDLDDGVRMNIRPFMKADVLRWKPKNIKWEKDRGKNPDGSERLNDLHFTIAEKQEARQKAGLAT